MYKAQRGHVDVKSHIVWEGRPEGHCSCLDASLALDSEYILSQRSRLTMIEQCYGIIHLCPVNICNLYQFNKTLIGQESGRKYKVGQPD